MASVDDTSTQRGESMSMFMTIIMRTHPNGSVDLNGLICCTLVGILIRCMKPPKEVGKQIQLFYFDSSGDNVDGKCISTHEVNTCEDWFMLFI